MGIYSETMRYTIHGAYLNMFKKLSRETIHRNLSGQIRVEMILYISTFKEQIHI